MNEITTDALRNFGPLAILLGYMVYHQAVHIRELMRLLEGQAKRFEAALERLATAIEARNLLDEKGKK